MTVGYFSPLPPARTGVADYAAALLRGLETLGTVRINDASAGAALYHLGNNQLHRDIYRQALERPGVVVLHDAVLSHFFLGSLTETDFTAEFVYNYGEWNRDLARTLWRGRARSAADPRYFAWPMLRRIAERSLAVVVHNPEAARRVTGHAPGARVIEIPHLFQTPAAVPQCEIERLRFELGVEPGTSLFGVFGHLRESKRLFAVLEALKQVDHASLLVSGAFASADLERAVAPLLARRRVHRAGYLPEAEFWRHAHAVDACINLRYPPAGETSGIAIRLMGIGKPVILTTGEETSGFPETGCLRVDPGPAETAMLADSMRWLARFPLDAREIGRRAAAHIASRHSLERVARQYWEALQS